MAIIAFMQAGEPSAVCAWTEDIVIPTYLPAAPDRNPMFLERRVYQGSSGKVYPLPFTDRVAEKPVDRQWKAVWVENEFLKVMILPELGGRIHRVVDKTNGYDLIYYQPTIKPALVGLAGPWISGGIEFNWPQHHRPATFLPVDYQIEEHADGSRTVWCSDHDPMARMKGMHGVCLHPGRAILELKVRAYNRTALPQTFLWWANVATRVHEAYQSFFPPDVHYVADHARRSMSSYPLANGSYYGVDYAKRGREGVPQAEVPPQYQPPHCRAGGGRGKRSLPQYAANDLSWYANIPTPCSYMCMGSKEDFFGGYDYKAEAGIIHVANHHISPGKKQWTWGNHPFGYAWDRNLTDATADGEHPPYIELMAGVYTDNQPDFSFLAPGETKTWSQYWYPIQKIGPAHHATVDAAVSLAPREDGARIGVCVTRSFPRMTVRLERPDGSVAEWRRDVAPGKPVVIESRRAPNGGDGVTAPTGRWRIQLRDESGREVLSFAPEQVTSHESLVASHGAEGTGHESLVTSHREGGTGVPAAASEPALPKKIGSVDELYVTGLHLEQYRHATRCPTLYWREALRRDPLDARCNNAMGLWHMRRGEFATAETHFRRAIERLTLRNANPYDGEPFYNLGLCLRHQLDSDVARNASSPLFEGAYAAFYKATWNRALAAPAFHAVAEMDCRRGHWTTALDHLNRSLRFDTDNLGARNLKVLVLRRLAHDQEAAALLEQTLRLDPLDWCARLLAHQPVTCDVQTALDIAHDLSRAGFCDEAISLLEPYASSEVSGDLPTQSWGALPLLHYTLGWLYTCIGDAVSSAEAYQRAAAAKPDYCFPARLEEIAILEQAMAAQPGDARAPFYLGNLFYDKRRYENAIKLWERSVALEDGFATAWRNLGIAYYNVRGKATMARAAYENAVRCDPADARLLYERDQLWKRTRVAPARRLAILESRRDLVQTRDDLSVELCALYNQTGQPEKALPLLSGRRFQPWEGGEGQALGQHVRTQLALGRQALAQGSAARGAEHFTRALESPENLGEARHLLANQSDVWFWLGCALAAQGNDAEARTQWEAAATFKGDFQEMSVRAFSEMTYYSAMSLERLERAAEAEGLLRDMLAYARRLGRATATIDYFATSLPTMLLFEDDLQERQRTKALFLEAQARLGLKQHARARALLRNVLKRDPSHSLAADLLQELPS